MTTRPGGEPSGAGAARGRPLTGSADPAAAVRSFCGLLEEELACRRAAGQEAEPLRRYLRFLFDPDGCLLPIAVRAYADRLRPIVALVTAAPAGLRVLDAGCGFGTESLLFALLGCDVVGVELVAERAALARSRIDFFAGRAAGPLRVRFVHANILTHLDGAGPYDLIWAMESVSHIHPPGRFLSGAHEALRSGGRLVVSDPNALSPIAWARAAGIRGGIRPRTHRRFADPETGRPVEYAQERIVTPAAMRRLLERHGFGIESTVISGYFATTVMPRAWLAKPAAAAALSAFQTAVRRIPGLRLFGAHYTITAVRSEDAQAAV